MTKILSKAIILAFFVASCAPTVEQKSEESALKRNSDKELIAEALAHYNKNLTNPETLTALGAGDSSQGSFGLVDTGSKGNKIAFDLGDRLRALKEGVNQDINNNLCRFVAPAIRTGGHQFTRPYVVLGYFSIASLVGAQGLVGNDFVWDLYNMQFAAFHNRGFGAAIGSNTVASVGGAIYAAIAFGKKDDVTAGWSGYFNSVGADAAFPNFLKGYFGVTGALFSGAKNAGVPGNNEGDWSMVGASVGLTAGFTATSELPVNIDIMNSNATLEPTLTDIAFRNFKDAGIPVSRSGSATCNGDCVRFDAGVPKGASYRLRGAQLARSFLLSTPLTMNKNVLSKVAVFEQLRGFSSLAIATGLFRDSANLAQSCRR